MPKHITVTRLLIAIPLAALLFAITPPVYSATIGSFPQLYDFNMANYNTLMCIGEVARLYVNARDIDKDDSYNDVYDQVYLKWHKTGSADLNGFVEGLIPAGGASTATYTEWRMPTSVGINGENNSLLIEYYNHDFDPFKDFMLVLNPAPPPYIYYVFYTFWSQVYWTTACKPSNVHDGTTFYEYTPEDRELTPFGRTLVVPYNMQLGTRIVDKLWGQNVYLVEDVTIFKNYLKVQYEVDTGSAPFRIKDGSAFDHVEFYSKGFLEDYDIVPVGTNGLSPEYRDQILHGQAPFLVLEQSLYVDNKFMKTRYQKFAVDYETRQEVLRKDGTVGDGFFVFNMSVSDTP